MTPGHPTDLETVALAQHGWFFVGGEYVDRGTEGIHLQGAAYVERYVPAHCTQAVPVVMIHGGVQTASNFTASADGRRGWLHDFLRAGFSVYLMEQPERGRSGHALAGAGAPVPLQRYPVARIEERFTAPASRGLWPQAHRHTQWPGTGLRGDPIFDNFFASQVAMLADRTEAERRNRAAGVALLDRIGAAILVTHSQSGPFGWLIADQRPSLVKAIVALEPNGPPFHEVLFQGGEDWHRYDPALERPFGLTRLPLCFDPPVAAASELAPVLSEVDVGSDRVPGYLQREPARRLVNLAGIPILIMVSEASYHAAYDHATSAFLRQAGVAHDLVALAERGLTGNGHMVMMERNNHAVADLMLEWLADRGSQS